MHILLVILLFIAVCVAVCVFWRFILGFLALCSIAIFVILCIVAAANHPTPTNAADLQPAAAVQEDERLPPGWNPDGTPKPDPADPPPVAISPPEPAPDPAPPSTDNVMQTMAPAAPDPYAAPAPPPALDQRAPASDGIEKH